MRRRSFCWTSGTFYINSLDFEPLPFRWWFKSSRKRDSYTENLHLSADEAQVEDFYLTEARAYMQKQMLLAAFRGRKPAQTGDAVYANLTVNIFQEVIDHLLRLIVEDLRVCLDLLQVHLRCI